MDLATLVLLGVVAVMGLNQLVMRVGGLRARALVFWSLQGLNLATGAFIIGYGIPGLHAYRAIPWMIGLLFFFRVVQNNNLRARWLREELAEARREKERAVREALDRS